MDRVARGKSAALILLEYWAVLFLFQTLVLAPWLGGWYGWLLDRAVPRLRRIGLRNLELVYPAMPLGERNRIIDGVFRSIGRVLSSLARFPKVDPIRYEGYEHFEEARRRGKGVLFATAHLGNWELSAFAHAIMSRPMYVVVRPLDNPKLDALVERRRALSGNFIISKREFTRPILRALRDNEAVGILVDQNVSLDSGAFVDFLGVPACVHTGFAKLAAHSGAAVIPGFAVWSEKEKGYVLRFYPIVDMSGDAEADTQAIQKSLELAISEYPDQWLWIHRRWKTRPRGEPSLYN